MNRGPLVSHDVARERTIVALSVALSVALPVALSVALALALLLACAAPALAQRPAGGQVEGRLDLIAARTPSVQGGLGVNVPAGLYVRLGGVVAGGVARRDGAARGAARLDLSARFLLDPFRERPRSLYGLGGLSAMHDGFEGWRPRVLIGVGIESRPRGGYVTAAEVVLGGGVRAGLVVRRARAFGR